MAHSKPRNRKTRFTQGAALMREDIVTPMHHHDEAQDALLVDVDGQTKHMTGCQADGYVTEKYDLPELTDVDHVDGGPTNVKRRHILAGAAAGFGALLTTTSMPRYSFAAPSADGGNELLVCVFMRGGFDGLSAVVHLAVAALVVYVATWTSWLLSDGGYDRQWGAQHPADRVTRLLGDGLGSLWHYHYDIYAFHTGDWIASQTHTYDAKPLGWPVMARVIGIDAVNGIRPGEDGCTAVNDTCLRVVSGAGTPFLWWFACLAVVVGLFLWIGGRQWHYCVPIVAASATWLMWFPSSDRPTFFFYAIMLIPFTATVLAMVLGRILGPADAPPPRRRRGALVVTAVTALITANFLFIYPILTDTLLTRRQWLMRMWFSTWI